ncbi:MAG: hypothetical protein ACLFTK_02880 [Anaerolineales bacterium]
MTKPARLLILVVLLGLAWPVAAQQYITSQAETPLRGREAPSFAAPVMFEIPAGDQFTLLGLAPDAAWIQVRYQDELGWLPRAQTPLPRGWQARFIADVPSSPPPQTNMCISLVGDSVAHGTVVYVVPGHGFGVLRTTPLGDYLTQALNQRGLGYLAVHDRTSSAAFLSPEGRNPYRQMEAYALLLEDNCAFTIIMPWINDMSLERADNAARHLADLALFVAELRAAHPAGRVLVLGHYYGAPSDFAAQHAPGYQAANIARFNDALQAACNAEGALGQQAGVFCLPIADLFADMDNAHVVQGIDRAGLLAELVEPIPADVAPLFEAYWGDNPAGLVYGDGVHLNELGKQQLADMLVETLLNIAPHL